jgi:uncharacterized membrane protein HdeD (DUF308 family)
VPGWCWVGLVVVMAAVDAEAPLQVLGWDVAAVVLLYSALALAVAVTVTMRRRSARLPAPGRWVYLLAGLVGGVVAVLLAKRGATGAAGAVYVLTVVLVVAAVLMMRRTWARTRQLLGRT